MNTIDSRSLQDIITSALERTAFMIVDPSNPDITNDLPPAHASASIQFTGCATGTVIVSASKGFLIELSSGILGVEPHEVDVDDQGLDALRELTNIFGGEIVKSLGGDDHPCTLGLPQVIESMPSTWPTASCMMDAAGELLQVSWYDRDAAKKAA